MTKNSLSLPLQKQKSKNLNLKEINPNKKKIKIKKNNRRNLRKMMKNKNLTLKVKAGMQVWTKNKLKMIRKLNKGMEDQVEDNLKLNNKKTIKFLTKATGNNKQTIRIKSSRKTFQREEVEKMMTMNRN